MYIIRTNRNGKYSTLKQQVGTITIEHNYTITANAKKIRIIMTYMCSWARLNFEGDKWKNVKKIQISSRHSYPQVW